jgi:hypothetical protein
LRVAREQQQKARDTIKQHDTTYKGYGAGGIQSPLLAQMMGDARTPEDRARAAQYQQDLAEYKKAQQFANPVEGKQFMDKVRGRKVIFSGGAWHVLVPELSETPDQQPQDQE